MTDVQRPVNCEHLVLNIRNLPSIPTVVADALRVISDPRSGAVDIEAVVQRDQSLTAKVLRAVNSAAYGFSRRIGTIREAATLLGMRKIKTLASSLTAFSCFKGEMSGVVKAEDLWGHALSSSIWASEILQLKKLWSADMAVTAALLHDLGILILCEYATDPYRQVLEESRRQNRPHSELEKEMLGVTHASVGGMLCVKWQMPPAMSQLISRHHAPGVPSSAELSVVMLADQLAGLSGAKPLEWEDAHEAPLVLFESLGISDTERKALMEMQESVQKQTAVLRDIVRDGE